MKKLVALPIAVLFAVACSEPTASPAASDITNKIHPSGTFSVADFGYSENFEGFTASSASPFAPSVTAAIPAQNTLEGTTYLGKFTNGVLTMSTTYTAGAYLNFSLIIAGTWDGISKNYGPDTWQIDGYCGTSATGTPATTFTTTFSNKRTTKQNYPDPFGGAVNAGLTDATEVGQLGFSSTGEVLVTNKSVSTYSAVYLIGMAYPSCPSGTTDVTWVMRNPSQELQQVTDEFWGLDNISIGTLAPNHLIPAAS